MSRNSDLKGAKRGKKDEFYTQINDIIAEIAQHPDMVRHFEGKTVLCNCDDPEWSNFVEFFRKFFKKLKLKKMIATHYTQDGSPSYKLEWYGEKLNGDTVNLIKTPLKGDGDFRSEECIELLKEADIVVTNPPFSLFREYIAQLVAYDKKFLIIGNVNAISYKEVFPLIKENKLWLGQSIHSGDREFRVPDSYPLEASGYRVDEDGNKYIKVKGVRWFTNLDTDERHEFLPLTKNYKGNEHLYPKYDNYDAINVDKTADIPKDYDGVMGVPITFIDKYCPEQFEILDINPHFFMMVEQGLPKLKQLTLRNVGRKDPYARILLRKKCQEENKDESSNI